MNGGLVQGMQARAREQAMRAREQATRAREQATQTPPTWTSLPCESRHHHRLAVRCEIRLNRYRSAAYDGSNSLQILDRSGMSIY